MGGWVLEVSKMAMYLAFPVCLFHYFNYPENIDADVQKMRDEYIDKTVGLEKFELKRAELLERKKRRAAETAS